MLYSPFGQEGPKIQVVFRYNKYPPKQLEHTTDEEHVIQGNGQFTQIYVSK